MPLQSLRRRVSDGGGRTVLLSRGASRSTSTRLQRMVPGSPSLPSGKAKVAMNIANVVIFGLRATCGAEL